MLKNSLIITMALLLVSGCATDRNDNLDRLRTLPQQYAGFDMKMAWDVKPVDGSTQIDGVVKNIRYYEMDELEIWVASLDAQGKEEHRAVDYVYRLMEKEIARFTLEIPRVTSGSKLRFTYRYTGYEGGGESGNAQSWRQTFESVVP